MNHLAWQFACPTCGAALTTTVADQARCPADGYTYPRVDGVWRMLSPDRAAYFARFIHEYETVRAGEGRGSHDPGYYRALPFRDLSGRMPEMWAQRAQTFNTFVRAVLEPFEVARSRPSALHILDLGAGNGWLSYRLAQRGHRVAAVDLTVNDFDGLACVRHYAADITAVQAEFDRLPFADPQADLAIFNASLHYSSDIAATLHAVKRVLRPDGRLVVIDTPVYRSAASGDQMVAERRAAFQVRYGFPSSALPSENFLTFARIAALEQTIGLRWQLFWPVAGWRRTLRRARDRVNGRREAAQFPILVASTGR